MNKLLLSIAVFASILAIYKLLSDDEQKVIKSELTNVSETKKDNEKKKKTIEILYLDENKKEKVKKDIGYTQKETTQVDDRYDLSDAKDIKQYIEDNSLVDVTLSKNSDESEPKPEFSVYADISEDEAKQNYDKNLPPPAPAFVSGTTATGSVYNVVIPPYTNILSQKIVITKNDSDGEPVDASKLDTSDSSSAKDAKTTEDEPKTVLEEPTDFTLNSPPSPGS